MTREDIRRAFLELLGRDAEDSAVSFYSQKELSYDQLVGVIKNTLEYQNKNPSYFGSDVENNKKHRNSFVEWPKPQLFVAENIKVVYCPIAKNACSSLKRLLVQISDIPRKDEVLKGDIHTQTDDFNTGIHLKDLDESSARAALFDPSYFRFVVLRDPASRLLSAYWEKFVVNRMTPANLNITTPVLEGVAQLEGRRVSSPEKGITFKQFVNYVSKTEANHLDPHWRPQFKYFEDLDITKFYNQNNLQPLYETLTRICGYELFQGKNNVTNSGKGEYVAMAYDLLPDQLLSYAGVSKESLFSKSITSDIYEAYKVDYEFMHKCES